MLASLFDQQPHLTGDSIYLRPLQANDADALYKVASDPLVWQQHPSPFRYQREIFNAQIFESGLTSKSTLVAIDLKTSLIIGSSRYSDAEENFRKVEKGFTFLGRSHWGGVVNGEMKKLMLDHAFNWAKRVWFHIAIENIRSQKAIEKIGAKLSHLDKRTVNGISVTHCYYFIDAVRRQRVWDQSV